MKSTVNSDYYDTQSIYEDPDALKLYQPAVTDGNQSEVKVRPVPRPRSKMLPKPKSDTPNNTVEPAEKTGNADEVSSEPPDSSEDIQKPQPVRPPPRPPLSRDMTLKRQTAIADGGGHYVNSNSETTVKAPAVNPEKVQSRPERPPPPSIYYDRSPLTTRSKSESYTDGSQNSDRLSISSMSSLTLSEEALSTTGTSCSMPTDSTDKPAVPPRLGQSLLSHSTPPSQNRPPPPPSLESLYNQIENRPYLPVLPEDGDMSNRRSTVRSGPLRSDPQSMPDTEVIYGMLRWLKRVSKSDVAPSLYGLSIEEEIRSFHDRAVNVKKSLRLFNLLMMKRNESLREVIIEFDSIANSLDKNMKKNKTMDIAGGTTGAVGGVTAVLGIALAPMTMGASLIATAVGGAMVASAGGMGAHTAKANKKIVNRMTVDKLVCEYKEKVVDLEHCLDFILSEMNELRRHDIARLQRAGAQADALKMAHLSHSVIRNNMDNHRKVSMAHTSGMSSERLLQAFAKEMDLYFTEQGGQKLKKSNKSKFSGRVRLLARNLQDELDHLNQMWEKFN